MDLKITNLTKAYNNTPILTHINLNIRNVQSLVLIGPSGGGKTTLLRILAGLESPTEGSIFINDSPIIYEEKKLREYRKKIGIVFQAYNLFPHLTALENICLPLTQVHGFSPQVAKEEALMLLTQFHLEDHAYKKPSALSGGQQQRVAICRAVSTKPDFLLLDEPTSALDPEYTSEVLELIEELMKDGMRLILVTHEMGFARSAAKHILFLADGKIIDQGTPKNLFDHSPNPRVRSFFQKVLKYG